MSNGLRNVSTRREVIHHLLNELSEENKQDAIRGIVALLVRDDGSIEVLSTSSLNYLEVLGTIARANIVVNVPDDVPEQSEVPPHDHKPPDGA